MTPLRVAAAVLACLSGLLAAAALALADGEDDPTFGTGGSSFAFALDSPDDGLPIGTPYTDQAPDGSVVTATLLRHQRFTRGSLPSHRIVVSRMDGAGALVNAFGGNGNGLSQVAYFADDMRLLDLRVLADGRIVLAAAIDRYVGGSTDTVAAEPEQRGGVYENGLLLVTLPVNGEGAGEVFHDSPCGDASAAEIAADGQAFVLWNGGCKGPEALGHTAANPDDDTAVPLNTVDGVDVALGPDDAPYLLASPYDFQRGTASDIDSVVLKFTTALEPAPGYKSAETRFDGEPIDISVDGSGRAVVWYSPFQFPDDRGAATGGRWLIGRLKADGTLDADGFGTGGTAVLEGPDFGFVEAQEQYEGQCLFESGFGYGFDRCRVWQLKAGPDGKVLASGPPATTSRATQRGGEYRLTNEWTLARLDAAGKLDVTWDDDGVGTPPAGDGIKTVLFEGAADGQQQFAGVGTPALQADRKTLLPFFAMDPFDEVPGRVAPVPAQGSIGVERLNATPPPTTTTPTETTTTPTQTQTQTPPPPVTQTQASQAAPPKPVTVPSKSCTSRREFKIRLRTGRKKSEESAIKTAEVRVNGKKVPVTKEARLRSVVNLKNLPKGRFSVSIKLVLADGGKVSETRRYRTCTKKIESELGPLRTSPPKKRGGK